MKPIRIALIGAGRIGRMHAEAICSKIENLELVAIVDPHPDRAWAAALHVPAVYEEPTPLFAQEELDAVLIASPSAFHLPLIRRAIEQRLHVFCEKPIAFVPAQLTELHNELSRSPVQLMVGLNRRFDPQFSALRQAVHAGKIGVPQLVRITNRDPKRPPLEFVPDSGGLFMDFTVHDLDMARFVTGEDIAEVHAMGAALIDPRLAELGDIDTAVVTLRMQSGALCVIDNSREAVYGYDQRVEVLGTGGAIEAQNVCPHTCVVSNAEGVTSAPPHATYVERYAASYVAELEAFARCLREHSRVPVTLEDMLKAVRAAQAAQQSLATGATVAL